VAGKNGNPLAMVRIVAPSDATVLINGETGTGKELITKNLT
jgi:transcriptional regulator with GAF, ATPase, and Fis domain